MKILSIIPVAFCLASHLFAQSADFNLAGYRKKDSTYIQPIYRTSPKNSILQYYSGKGSFNPHTGMPDWTDAYVKVSTDYRKTLPDFYKEKYSELFHNLIRKDTLNYFKVVNSFVNSYKLFFTGLFEYNANNIEGAFKTFEKLDKLKGKKKDTFTSKENIFWLDVTSKYAAATREFIELSSAIEKFETEQDYEAILKKIEEIKNPLNFYDKYLLKYDYEVSCYRYRDAIEAVDSLKKYSPDADRKDLVIGNYKNLVDILLSKESYLNVVKNKTYYYPLDSLYYKIGFYLTMGILPPDLEKASFILVEEKCTKSDSFLTRSLVDTLKSSTTKISQSLNFNRYLYDKEGDTLVFLEFSFADSPTYNFYQTALSDFKDTHPLKRTLAYVFENWWEGLEYMISRNVVAGLLKNRGNSSYKLYLYCIGQGGKFKNLMPFFKESKKIFQ